jgi:UDP-N-acetyl-D-galactosamine dehydrogenase
MVVDFYDPYLLNSFKARMIKNPLNSTKKYDAIIVAVAHNEFKNYTRADFTKISKGKLVLLDIKGIYNKSYWQL